MFPKSQSVQALQFIAWMHIEDPAMTFAEAEAELVRLGNTILERDEAGRRFKVLDTTVSVDDV